MYQADLAKIGVKLNIQTDDPATWIDKVNNRKYEGMYFASAAGAQLSPSTFYGSGRGLRPVDNNSGFKNDRYQQLIMSASTEPDPAKQRALYSQINDIYLDESFSMVLSPSPTIMIASAAVHDIGFTLHTAFTFTDAWIGD
jgi:peptide/nickel transport system substrate-binding protein